MENGNDLRLGLSLDRFGSREPVLHEVSISFDYSDSLVEVTRSNTRNYAEFIPNRHVYSINVEGLMDYSGGGINSVTLLDKALDGRLVYFDILGRVRREFGGAGYITNVNHSGSSDDVASISFTIQPTGEVTRSIETALDTLCNMNITLCNNGETLCAPVRIN